MTLARRALGLAAVVLAVANPARGEIYRWTDAQGRIHFTERIDQVPAEHRAAARERAAASAPDRVHTYSGSASDAPAAPAPVRGSRREIEIPFTRMGSLMRVDASVNDVVTVPFLIDTGASGVSIPSSYAAKLGVRIRPDTPHVQVTTANGVVARPLISLRSIEIAGARVENLSATIDPGLDFGLLGGSFFNNYVYRVDAARAVITLAPNDQMRGGLDEAQWRERFRSANRSAAPARGVSPRPPVPRGTRALGARDPRARAPNEPERSRTPRGRARRAADLAGWRRKMRFAADPGVARRLGARDRGARGAVPLHRARRQDDLHRPEAAPVRARRRRSRRESSITPRHPRLPSATRTSFPRLARANRQAADAAEQAAALWKQKKRDAEQRVERDPRAARLDPEIRELLQPGRLGHHARRGGHPAGRQLHGIAPRVHTRSKRRRPPRASTSPRVCADECRRAGCLPGWLR